MPLHASCFRVSERFLEQGLQARCALGNAVWLPMKLQAHAVLVQPYMVIANAVVVLVLKTCGHQRSPGALKIGRRHHEVDVTIGAQTRIRIQHARRHAF